MTSQDAFEAMLATGLVVNCPLQMPLLLKCPGCSRRWVDFDREYRLVWGKTDIGHAVNPLNSWKAHTYRAFKKMHGPCDPNAFGARTVIDLVDGIPIESTTAPALPAARLEVLTEAAEKALVPAEPVPIQAVAAEPVPVEPVSATPAEFQAALPGFMTKAVGYIASLRKDLANGEATAKIERKKLAKVDVGLAVLQKKRKDLKDSVDWYEGNCKRARMAIDKLEHSLRFVHTSLKDITDLERYLRENSQQA